MKTVTGRETLPLARVADIDRNREQLIEIMAHNGAEIGSAADPKRCSRPWPLG